MGCYGNNDKLDVLVVQEIGSFSILLVDQYEGIIVEKKEMHVHEILKLSLFKDMFVSTL